jgi:hypothetical protein
MTKVKTKQQRKKNNETNNAIRKIISIDIQKKYFMLLLNYG